MCNFHLGLSNSNTSHFTIGRLRISNAQIAQPSTKNSFESDRAGAMLLGVVGLGARCQPGTKDRRFDSPTMKPPVFMADGFAV